MSSLLVFNRVYRLEIPSDLLVFSTQLVNCCPHGGRSYTCVLLPLYMYLLSDLLPPPLPKLKVQYITDSAWLCGC